MKTILTLMALISTVQILSAQGRMTFRNDSLTLISAGGALTPVRGTQEFIFAIFLADPSTVSTAGITPALNDPNFQVVDPDAYTTNSLFTPGRITPRDELYIGAVQGYSTGSTVDFIVRGWSANAGYTWAESLANWNNGVPLVSMYIGSSTVGDNIMLLGGLAPNDPIFGFTSYKIQGFDMAFVPEPSVAAIMLGGCALFWKIRRRQRHRLTK